MKTERSPIFRNGEPRLDSGERAQLNRLLDLEEIARHTASGEKVDLDFIADRLLKTEAQSKESRNRVADRRARLLFDEARFLGHTVSFQKDPERDEGAQWVVVFDDLEGFLRDVSTKIAFVLGREETEGRRRYERTKAAGICVFCKKVPAQPGAVACRKCAAYFRELREGRIEAGVCPECRGRLDDPSFSACSSCRAEQRELEGRRRRRGRCTECEDPAEEGRAYCVEHARQASEYHARRYRQLKEKGLCRCKRPLVPGQSTCADCRAAMEAAAEAREASRRSSGLCLKCTDRVVPGLTVCAKHREVVKSRSRSKREKLKAAGLCRSCRKPWTGEALDCEECRAKFAAAKAAKLASGLCQNCGEGRVVTGMKRCQKCIDEAKARYEALKAQGICVTCKKNKVDVPGQDTICAACRKKSRDRYLAKRATS